MPPDQPLSTAEIVAVENWIREGAKWTDPSPLRPTADANAVAAAERAPLWSFQPIKSPEPPIVQNQEWVRNDIDAFILARLEAARLQPAPPAEPSQLLRRLTFDLTGLPPSADLCAAIQGPSPVDYEQVVDMLLDSVHYGEQAAHRWLDLVRYAESTGHECDFEIGHVWPYRDYLIRAFNLDLPYDLFVREQLAGDLIATPRLHPVDHTNESIRGSAFWWLGQSKALPVDLAQEEWDRIDNQIDVLSKTFLGLTVSCARCHDHKFDPITNEDYYALASYIHDARQDHAALYDSDSFQAQLGHLEASRVRLYDDWLANSNAAQIVRAASRATNRSAQSQSNRVLWGGATICVAGFLLVWKGRHKLPCSLSATRLSVVWTGIVGIGWACLFFATASRTDSSSQPSVLDAATMAAGITPPPHSDEPRFSATQAKTNTSSTDVVFDDFSNGFENWFVSGPAFGNGPTQDVRLVVDATSDVPVQIAPPHVAHSAIRSARLTGSLRSRTFTVTHKYIHYLVQYRSGERVLPALNQREGEANCVPMLLGPIRLIVHGYQLIPKVRLGKMVVDVPDSNSFAWVTQEVGEWKGEQAYIEVRDEHLGWIAVDSILFSDRSDPPLVPATHGTINTFSDRLAFQNHISDLYDETIRLCSQGELVKRPDAFERVQKLNLVLRLAGSRPNAAISASLNSFLSIEESLPKPQLTLATSNGSGATTYVLPNGDPHHPSEPITPRFIEALGQEPFPQHTQTRLDLARHLVDRDNPLVARVIVNRLWQWHFGRGLVPTPDNFGHLGEPPTHMELLDYLARKLIDNRWSLKHIHRLIVTSATYQMSSQLDPAAEEIDPNNRLWHRANIRRLDGEIIRDAILSASGRLDATAMGPGVAPYLAGPIRGSLDTPESGPLDGHGRRSIYLTAFRNFEPLLFSAFDAPSAETTTGLRSVSNVPQQLLVLLDDPFVIQQAEFWADRIQREFPGDRNAAIDRMHQEAFARPATAAELQDCIAFLNLENSTDEAARAAWRDLARALFNSKEFYYLH